MHFSAHPLLYCHHYFTVWFALISLFVEFSCLIFILVLYLGSPHSSDKMGAAGVKTCARACVFVFTSSPSATEHRVFVLPPPQQITQRGVKVV